MKRLKSVKHQFVKALFCFIMVGAMATSLGMGAFAATNGNYQDSRVATRYSGDGSDVVTPARQKQDSTSSYIYNDQSDYYFSYVSVDGCTSTTSNRVDCTDPNQDTYVAKGQSKKLLNYVYENGYSYARLAVNPGPKVEQYVSFLWSPDSV